TGQKGADLLDLWAQARCRGVIGSAIREASAFLGLSWHCSGNSKTKPKVRPTDVVSPIPPDAPPPPERHPELGAPAMRHEYLDQRDRVLFYVDRYDTLHGKEI